LFTHSPLNSLMASALQQEKFIPKTDISDSCTEFK
jgi:hypothetical protein